MWYRVWQCLSRWFARWFCRTSATPPADDAPEDCNSPTPPPDSHCAPDPMSICTPAAPPSLPTTPPQPEAIVGYATAREYLDDQLRRVSYLVKAYILRRQHRETLLPHALAAVTVRDFGAKRAPLVQEMSQPACDQLDTAEILYRRICQRLKATPNETLQHSPLLRLQTLLWTDTIASNTGEEHCRRRMALQLDVLLLTLLDYHYADYRHALSELTADDGVKLGELSVAVASEICQLRPAIDDDSWSLLAGDLPLVQQLYVSTGAADLKPSQRGLRIDPAIARYLLEQDAADSELKDSTVFDVSRSQEQLDLDESTLQALQQLRHNHAAPNTVILLHGPAGAPFAAAARHVLGTSAPLLTANVAQAASWANWSDWTTRVRRLARLHGAAILWHDATAIIESARSDTRWRDLLQSTNTRTFITAETAWDPDFLTLQSSPAAPVPLFARIEFPIPRAEVRQRIWKKHLEAAQLALQVAQQHGALELLASFQFTEGQVAAAIALARGLELTAGRHDAKLADLLYDACRRVSARGLVTFTQRIPPRKYSSDVDPLNTVILAPEGKDQLRELHQRIQNLGRVCYEYGFGNNLSLGRGLIALFSGPSGTGKTFAAATLASCQGRDLYKVDMAAVVSKYVGETEKNLSRVFSDAQSANALLFFDEADAIFGKRGDVDKAQDRWANMEVNYLLQRVEEFPGVVILATNLKQNIDEAFLRRVQVLIDFKAPDAADRRRILVGLFPPTVERPDDAELKAFCDRFELTGGNLKNVVIDAAFRALQSSQLDSAGDNRLRVSIEHLVQATAREYRKLSRPVTLSSFGPRYFEIVKQTLRID